MDVGQCSNIVDSSLSGPAAHAGARRVTAAPCSRRRRGSGPRQPGAAFTGPLARSLALVAIVIGGLLFMFGEGGAKRQISGIVFGGGLALFAAQFLTWLF